MTRALIMLAVLGLTAAAPPQPSVVYKLEELAWPQIAAFDRERTLFILPVGMLEEHGPLSRSAGHFCDDEREPGR